MTSRSRAGPRWPPSQPSSSRSDAAQSAVDERARGAEERPQAARRHPELVQVLGIVPPAGAGIVREQRQVLGLERDPERLPGRRALLAHPGVDGPRQVERAVELRLQLAGRPGAGPAQLLLELAQRSLVAVEQLDLDLPEAARHVLALEHGDAVVHDLGAAGADPLPAGAQARDGHERGAAEIGRQQGDQLGRGPRRRSRQLELEPGRVTWELQLPEPGAVLDAMAERDAVPREAQVRGVVVGGDEDARRQPLGRRARAGRTPHPGPA